MNPARVWVLFIRDLGRGPRSPAFLYAVIMPIIITVVTKVILLTLFDPKPRLGIVDLGESQITATVERMTGIELVKVRAAAELRRLVEDNDVDAGLVLAKGFDDQVKAGKRPRLDFYFSGESRVSQRIVLAITSLDLIRHVEGLPAPVVVNTKVVGGSSLPIESLVILGILLWPLLVCSTLVPGLLLVQEREQGTLHALLVTPTTMTEVMLAKALLGFTTAMAMCLTTLLLADALKADPLALLVTLSVALLICNEIGLIYGALAKDGKTLYNLAQTMNIVILAPLMFYFFPDWPQSIAKLLPTWWFIDPLYRVTMQGAVLVDVWSQLVIAMVVAAVLAIPVVWLGRRMLGQMA
jgi:ABC-2 type transport system permease protein